MSQTNFISVKPPKKNSIVLKPYNVKSNIKSKRAKSDKNKEFKNRKKYVYKIAHSEKILSKLDLTIDEVDGLINAMVHRQGLTWTQVKWFFLTMIRIENPELAMVVDENGNSVFGTSGAYLINVFDGPTGSGKSWFQEFVMTNTNLLFTKSTFFINFTSPFQMDTVLKSNLKHIIKAYKTKHYQFTRALAQKEFMILVHRNIYEGLNPEEMTLADELISGTSHNNNKSHMTVFDSKTDLESIISKYSKIIVLGTSMYLDKTVVPALIKSDLSKFKIKINIFDEAHREAHTMLKYLISLCTTQTTSQYTDRSHNIVNDLTKEGFVNSFFTGTSSVHQRSSNRVILDRAKENLDSREYNTVVGDENNLMSINRFKFHALSPIEKDIVAIRNSPLGEVYDLTANAYSLMQQEGVCPDINILPHKHHSYNGKGIKLKVTDITNTKFLNDTTNDYYNSRNQSQKDKVIAQLLGTSGTVDKPVKILNKHLSFIWEAFNIVTDKVSGKLVYDCHFEINTYYERILKHTIDTKVFNNSGLSLVRVDKKGSVDGMDLLNFKTFLNKNHSKDLNKVLIHTGEESRLASSTDPKQFGNMHINDILSENPEIKMIVIIEKLGTGVSINNIHNIFILMKEKSRNGEYLRLEQLVGRGVRQSTEPLNIYFNFIGTQEVQVLDRIINDRQTIVPLSDWEYLNESLTESLEEGRWLLTEKVLEDCANQFNEYVPELMLSLESTYNDNIRRETKKGYDLTIHENISLLKRGLGSRATEVAEGDMHAYVDGKQRGGVTNRSDVCLDTPDGFMEIDFKFTTGTYFDRNISWSLKGADRTDGKLAIDNLFICTCINITENLELELRAYLVEFKDENRTSVTENMLIENNSDEFRAFRIC